MSNTIQKKLKRMSEQQKLAELNAPETVPPIKPEPLPILNAIFSSDIKNTEIKVKEVKNAEITFEQLAKEKGYAPIPKEELPSTVQFKIAWLTFLSLVVGDFIYFLSNAVVDGVWLFTPFLWQMLIISTIKDALAVLIGKMLKYYNQKTEKIE